MVDRTPYYTTRSKLGEGAYGIVYEGQATRANRRVKSGTKVAIKVCKGLFGRHTGDTKRILREMKILRQMRKCKGIVKLLDYIPGKSDEVIFVFEHVATDLDQLINDEQYLSERHCKYIMHQMVLGLRQLHNANIVHRDLKPANILLTLNCQVKICDFNLARSMEWSKNEGLSPETWQFKPNNFIKSISQYVVTRWYRGPEVILSSIIREHVFALDVWSLACIFVEIMQMRKSNCRNYHLRRPLFPGRSCFPHSNTNPLALEDDQDQLHLILSVTGHPSKSDLAFYRKNISDPKLNNFLARFPQTPKANWNEVLTGENRITFDLLDAMLTLHPGKRATIEEVLEHPYFNKVRNVKSEKFAKTSKINWEYETQSGLYGRDFKNLTMKEIQKFKDQSMNLN